MPIFDGLELAQMIRQPDGVGNPYAPIIMLTGHSEKRRVMVARDAGDHEFLAKRSPPRRLPAHLNVVANPRAVHQDQELFRPGPPPQRQQQLCRRRAAQRRQGEVVQQPSLLDKARAPG